MLSLVFVWFCPHNDTLQMEEQEQNIEKTLDELVAQLNKVAETHNVSGTPTELERKRRRTTKDVGVQTDEPKQEPCKEEKHETGQETLMEHRTEQLEARISVSEKKQTQLAQQLTDMAQLLRDAREREQQLQQRCAMVRACEDRVQELEAKAQSTAQLRETTLAEFAGLQKQLTLLSMHHTALEAAGEDAQREIEELKQELETAAHQHEELSCRCSKLETEVVEKAAIVSRLEAAAEHSKTEKEELAGQAQRLREMLTEAEERNRTNMKHIEELTRHMKTHFPGTERANDGTSQESKGEAVTVPERETGTKEQDSACAGSC